MSTIHKHLHVCLLVALIVILALPAAAEKIIVCNVDELPRHTYEVSLKPSQLMQSDEAFAELTARMKSDTEETNLAAKLLARDPSLKPEDVVRLIKEDAEDFGKDAPMWVINPKRSLELLEKKLASQSG